MSTVFGGTTSKPGKGERRDVVHILVADWTHRQLILCPATKHRVKRKRTEITIEVDEVIYAATRVSSCQGQRRAPSTGGLKATVFISWGGRMGPLPRFEARRLLA